VKLSWRTELVQWLLLAGMFVLSAVTWSSAPERIPVHWNLAGEVDRYGGRFEGLLFLPLLAVALYLLLAFIPRLDPGRANYAQFARTYAVVRTAVLALLAAVQGVIVAWIRGVRFDISLAVALLAGALFIVLGNALPKIRPNWFVGVRTPWTLSSRTSWTKTHRAAGWVFMATGAVVLATGALRPSWTFATLLVGALGGSLGLVVYSYVVWRHASDKTAPAGTLPAE
jgi:uncharacterized membrane protein